MTVHGPVAVLLTVLPSFRTLPFIRQLLNVLISLGGAQRGRLCNLHTFLTKKMGDLMVMLMNLGIILEQKIAPIPHHANLPK